MLLRSLHVQEERKVKSDIDANQAAIAARRVLWIISLFSVALVLLVFSGCGQDTEATALLPAGSPQASDQPTSGAGDSSVSEPATPGGAETQEISPSPTQTDSTKVASMLTPAGEASPNQAIRESNHRGGCSIPPPTRMQCSSRIPHIFETRSTLPWYTLGNCGC